MTRDRVPGRSTKDAGRIGVIGGVPVDFRGDDQVPPGRAILQRLVGSADDPP